MSILDWLLVLVPVAFVMYMAFHSRSYVRSVADYLAAGRICGRYVISVADVANALSIIVLLTQVEMYYKTGFAMSFWNKMMGPLGLVLSLTGFCIYRFRETRAMSLGQWLEMRYSRPFRIFAAALRSVSEMFANMIMPALAARFFIYFLDLPHEFTIFGYTVQTFMVVVVITLTLATTIICLGGTLALVITDTIQGLFCYPMLVVFTIFVLCTFSWSKEIIPVMSDRVAGESFLNSFDVSNLRDFNYFALVVTIVVTIMHRASWIGAGNTSAAKTPHEQKMANILGTWRNGFMTIFYVLMGITLITLFNHRNFADKSYAVRNYLSRHISLQMVKDDAQRAEFDAAIAAVPPVTHEIGVDPPLSQDSNLDTPYYNAAREQFFRINQVPELTQELENLKATNPEDTAAIAQIEDTIRKKTGEANKNTQEYSTLYRQQMLAAAMRNLLPMGLTGLFCLLMVLMMVSTDDSRMYSAALTITQDVILPFKKNGFTPKQHIWVIRAVTIGVAVWFFFGSKYMSQLDYLKLYADIMCSMWMGGCGPVMVFGLYGRFGTTLGAWLSLLSGMFLSLGGMLVSRNWADIVYPWLDKHGWIPGLTSLLPKLSGPFEPYILWRMDPQKFPINSTEIYFITMMVSLVLYFVGSGLTHLIWKPGPFNLDRMLHRGKYNDEGKPVEKFDWSPKAIWAKVIGITPEYTKGDRAIAYSVFFYSFVYGFGLSFIGVLLLNAFKIWQPDWWKYYFFVVFILEPCIIGIISTFWFSIGGFFDLKNLFRDLRNRKNINNLDDGRVNNGVSVFEAETVAKEENTATADAPQEDEKK
ncbi:MAG: hypothetical protein J5654_07755 [Victivallales bacterium]|nr:hypothetical protein [Victivallales bacterium]